MPLTGELLTHLHNAGPRYPKPRCHPWGCNRWSVSRGSSRSPPRTGTRWSCPAEGSRQSASRSQGPRDQGTRCDETLLEKADRKRTWARGSLWPFSNSTWGFQREYPKLSIYFSRNWKHCIEYWLSARGGNNLKQNSSNHWKKPHKV